MCKHEDCLKDYEHAPKECTPEQIKRCYGDIKAEDHPCGLEIRGDAK
ncbi:MAG TPA: hypothetical protein HA232_01680 [Methanocellales archaeon]|nr:hypothetical protein [Methanocellales archaeon]